MKYMVYKTTNTANGKIYIGFHKFNPENIDDGYIGSGKLIRRAIEKYGKDSFVREVLFVFDTKEEAEAKEHELVDRSFVLREDTYNLALGGNVTILCGQANGFYGKTHSAESIKRMREATAATVKSRGYLRITEWSCFLDGKQFYTKSQIAEYLGCHVNNIRSIAKVFFEEYRGFFIDEDFEFELRETYKKILLHSATMALKKSIDTSKRFLGVPKTEEHKEKIKNSHIGKPHPWQYKINNNPEKIEKTRQKHIGSKRSNEARANIRNSVLEYTNSDGYVNPLSGKTCFYDPKTLETGFYLLGEHPEGWVKGNPKTSKKCYYDPATMVCKRFNDDEVPDGWLRGNPNIKRSKKVPKCESDNA